MPHVGQLIGWAREDIEQPIANQGYWDELSILDRINEAYLFHAALLTEARSDHYLEATADLATTSASQIAIPLPANCRRIVSVQVLTGSGLPMARRGIYREDIVRTYDSGATPTGCDYVYAVSGSYLYLNPPIGAVSAAAVRVVYVQDVSDLLMGTFEVDGSSNTVQFPLIESRTAPRNLASRDDHVYIGCDFQILTGAAAGDIRTVTAYIGKTVTANINVVFGGAVLTGNAFAMIPRGVPAQFHRMLSLFAAISMRQSRDEPWQHLQARYERYLVSFTNSIEDRMSEPASVREWDPGEGLD